MSLSPSARVCSSWHQRYACKINCCFYARVCNSKCLWILRLLCASNRSVSFLLLLHGSESNSEMLAVGNITVLSVPQTITFVFLCVCDIFCNMFLSVKTRSCVYCTNQTVCFYCATGSGQTFLWMPRGYYSMCFNIFVCNFQAQFCQMIRI